MHEPAKRIATMKEDIQKLRAQLSAVANHLHLTDIFPFEEERLVEARLEAIKKLGNSLVEQLKMHESDNRAHEIFRDIESQRLLLVDIDFYKVRSGDKKINITEEKNCVKKLNELTQELMERIDHRLESINNREKELPNLLQGYIPHLIERLTTLQSKAQKHKLDLIIANIEFADAGEEKVENGALALPMQESDKAKTHAYPQESPR